MFLKIYPLKKKINKQLEIYSMYRLMEKNVTSNIGSGFITLQNLNNSQSKIHGSTRTATGNQTTINNSITGSIMDEEITTVYLCFETWITGKTGTFKDFSFTKCKRGSTNCSDMFGFSEIFKGFLNRFILKK